MNRSLEYAQQLLEKARDDVWMLRRLSGSPQAPEWGLGFHAQQAVEKAIKAVLLAHVVEYPRTHDLERLLELVAHTGCPLPADAAELVELTEFGAPLRYETPPSKSHEPLDVAWLLDAVARTVQWAEEQVG